MKTNIFDSSQNPYDLKFDEKKAGIFRVVRNKKRARMLVKRGERIRRSHSRNAWVWYPTFKWELYQNQLKLRPSHGMGPLVNFKTIRFSGNLTYPNKSSSTDKIQVAAYSGCCPGETPPKISKHILKP